MSQWSFDDEAEDPEGPRWVGNARTLLLIVYPLVALGSAAFLVFAELALIPT